MINFIKSLFIDLGNRIDKMSAHVNTLDGLSPVAEEFRIKTNAALGVVKRNIHDILRSRTLDKDRFLRNNIIIYNSLNNDYLEIELFRFLAISKYGNAEKFFERIIIRIYEEIQCLQSIPFLSTISNSDTYYWAYTKYNMIALPQGEEKNLLNLSDLYHEIGHLIFMQSGTFLVGAHIPRMQGYYAIQVQRLKDDGESPSFIEDVKESIAFWNSSWSEEFACDLIATYLVGPAYAWTNMKICTVSSSYNAVFADGAMFSEHPPDESRMKAIFRMLELTGFMTELNEIKRAWNVFLRETQNTKPASYDLIFSDEMIDSITQNVLQGCQNIGLRSYSDQIRQSSKTIAQTINEAWQLIRSDHDSFNGWEAERLKELEIT